MCKWERDGERGGWEGGLQEGGSRGGECMQGEGRSVCEREGLSMKGRGRGEKRVGGWLWKGGHG